MYKMRTLSVGKYDDRGYSNEESIANLQIVAPEKINQFLTYNYGYDDDRFPLSFMTEGQGSKGVTQTKNTVWTWDTMGRLKFTDKITYFNPANVKPCEGGAEIEVHFESHWFIEQYGLIAPDGVTQVRIQKDLGESEHGYGYLLKATNIDPDSWIDPQMLVKGKFWSMTAPTVSESYSEGNRSNSMGPGKMTSQLEFRRYSKEIAGNLANTVTEYGFTNNKGEEKKLWINEEMRQFNLNMRVMNEERLWLAEYNRNVNGEILLKDRKNGKPIQHTAGMLEICRESNYDTYGEFLTLNKLKRTIGDITDTGSNDGKMEIVMSGGKGFLEDFDYAIKTDAKDSGFLTPLGEKEIQGMGDNLEYGAYFRAYKTIDGHKLIAKHASFFDKGTVAEAAKQNGMIHPRSGLPVYSHQGAIMDFTSYNGQANIRMVQQIGQAHKAKVLKGMSDVPPSWGVPDSNYVATDIDMSSYQIKNSFGLQVDDSTRMMLLTCKL